MMRCCEVVRVGRMKDPAIHSLDFSFSFILGYIHDLSLCTKQVRKATELVLIGLFSFGLHSHSPSLLSYIHLITALYGPLLEEKVN